MEKFIQRLKKQENECVLAEPSSKDTSPRKRAHKGQQAEFQPEKILEFPGSETDGFSEGEDQQTGERSLSQREKDANACLSKIREIRRNCEEQEKRLKKGANTTRTFPEEGEPVAGTSKRTPSPTRKRKRSPTPDSASTSEGKCTLVPFSPGKANVYLSEYSIFDHVPQAAKEKIWRLEYIDFSLLMMEDAYQLEDEGALSMRNTAEGLQLMPAKAKKEISSYHKWEAAWPIYKGILLIKYTDPGKVLQKTLELTQYEQDIYLAASTFIWEAVYNYNKKCRHKIASNPHRSWDSFDNRLWSQQFTGSHLLKKKDPPIAKKPKAGGDDSDVCFKYNQAGGCPFGQSCKFQHKCMVCGKWGHPATQCHHKKEGRNRDKPKKDKPKAEPRD